MKYLITGATGQLGREWVRFLKYRGLSYTAYSSAELDITDLEAVIQKIENVQPDLLINCAAYTDVDGAESESEKAFLVNETGVKNLANVCESVGAKLVHYSTDYVFSGSEKDQQKYPDGYPEDADTNPVNVYGKSKEAGEKILQQAKCDWMLIRVSWLCGRYGSNFIKTMLRLGAERHELSVVDDQIGCPSLAFDVVEKTHQLIEKMENGVFHISCEGKISWADLAEEVFNQSGLEVNLSRISSDEYPFTATRPMFTLLSLNKAKNTGLKPLAWKSGLKRILIQIEKKNKEEPNT
ncbi:dTDP-4-dehydrorhamnose reductase [Rhodohalobacter sulfatireducens]|uniref:dTDP-4-dehydrorhamnose reductase n=1 Tax=Rhodohalobacter sulfatireducens TaxID=2911366 RepID=A0ABS9KDW6_9BACT|nr:dTDP-4-dehydrorhamnose reductase [Rhodohalobacter sulfatireducens]MCG2589033.1 dTDP-4-dehydrorhamnose reductase [Rhodohalobacter sulfatireducens]